MADREFPTAFEDALDDDTVLLAWLVYIDWPGGAGRFWSGNGTLPYDGFDWAGAGELGSVDKVADSIHKKDIGVELTLNYLDDDIRNEIITADPTGSDASLFLALMGEDVRVVAIKEVFPGFVDEVEILDSGNSGQIKVRLASELARYAKPRYYQLTDAHQQDIFPGDRGMEFAPKLAEPVLWGRHSADVRRGRGAEFPGREGESYDR